MVLIYVLVVLGLICALDVWLSVRHNRPVKVKPPRPATVFDAMIDDHREWNRD